MKVYGAKLLDGNQSLTNCYPKVTYPVGEWIEVPGNGAYIAVTGGLICGGNGSVLAIFECEDEVEIENLPIGVKCFRKVRRLPELDFDKLTPKMKGEVACWAPGLSIEQRMQLAEQTTRHFKGEVARYASNLSAEQRLQLAKQSTPEWKGRIACWTSGLSAEQRMQLAEQTTPEMRDQIISYAPDLNAEQRMQLIVMNIPETKGERQ